MKAEDKANGQDEHHGHDEHHLNKTKSSVDVEARTASFVEDDLAPTATRGQKIGQHLLKSPAFEQFIGLVIFINFAVVIVETDRNASEEDVPLWVFYTSWALLLCFIVELVLKLFVLRSKFRHECWNVFDFCVITIDLVMSILDMTGANLFNISMLRVLRLARLARATKVLRVFPELRLMLAGLAGAMTAIVWGSVLLGFALTVWSVLAVQFIHPLNKKVTARGDYVSAGCDRCPHAYESTWQAAITFTTQIVAGDSWARETVPIIEMFPVSALFFFGVFVSVGLAILNLILGVVVNVATDAREHLLAEIRDEKLLQRMECHNQLLTMCREMDEDGNDELTFQELKQGFEDNEAFRATLEALDIGREDLPIVWTILDSDKSGTVTSKEFVSQVYKLKASDTQFMLAYIKYYITEIKDRLREEFQTFEDRVEGQLEEVQEGMEMIDQDVLQGREDSQASGKVETAPPERAHIAKCHCGNKFMSDSNFCRNCGAPRGESCQCGNVFMGDSMFCRKCGRPRNQLEGKEEAADESAPSDAHAAGDMNGTCGPLDVRELKVEITTPERKALQQLLQEPSRARTVLPRAGAAHGDIPVETPSHWSNKADSLGSIDLLFEQDSLRDLLDKMYMPDWDKEPVQGAPQSNLKEPADMLEQVEGAWKQCIRSIDEMRGFHSNLANLLEGMIRRVSLTIHHTVSASACYSASRAPSVIRTCARVTEQAEKKLIGLGIMEGKEMTVGGYEITI